MRKVEARIWAASYDLKRDAFRVALENGQIFLLRRPIPEDDHSEVLDIYIEGDGEVFTVVQASGHEFSVPWDVIQALSTDKMRTPDPEVGKRIGQRVKAIRKERGMTQDQLAKVSGLKRPNISRLEAGTHVPSISLIERLAEALQINISDLISTEMQEKGSMQLTFCNMGNIKILQPLNPAFSGKPRTEHFRL